jgi:hypothetical protein
MIGLGTRTHTRMLPSLKCMTQPKVATMSRSTPSSCTLRGRRRPAERAAVRAQRMGGACGASGSRQSLDARSQQGAAGICARSIGS